MRKTTKNCSKRKAENTEKTLADIDGEAEDGNKGFNACYLLTSLSPRHKGHSYIGFTVNPKRRIRQHNGEITSGATRTKKKRPWEMILCIYGFPTQVAALQFEWAWQHPIESLAVRKAACNLKSLNGLASKIKVAFTMLTLHTWQSMDLTVNFFSTKYMTHVADCPSLPRQMKVQFGSMDDLPCYYSGNQSLPNDENDWDLDPHECCGNDDDVEDPLRGSSNPVGENRHCFHVTASSPENQEDKESQKSQDNNVLDQRDPFLLGEDDDFQKHFNEDSGCNQVHPFDGRSPLPKGDSFFLIEDDDDMEDCLRRGLNPAAENSHYFDTTASSPENKEEQESQQSQENNVLEQRDSFFLGEDDDFQKHVNEDSRCNQVQPFEERSPLPKGDSFFLIEDDDLQEQFYEDSGFNLVQPFEGRSLLPKGTTVETQSSTVRQIEVIDLFTPSPDCKKRKVDSADTKIIDLTRSPDFVQL